MRTVTAGLLGWVTLTKFLGCSTLRGASRHAPFLRQLWTSEEVVSIVSDAAGIQLKPVMDYELGHTNILVILCIQIFRTVQQIPGCCIRYSSGVQWPGPDEEMQDHWHCDSYPFVAVMLLTDPKAGGSTVLQKGDGAEVALQYPAAGSCIVMQVLPDITVAELHRGNCPCIRVAAQSSTLAGAANSALRTTGSLQAYRASHQHCVQLCACRPAAA